MWNAWLRNSWIWRTALAAVLWSVPYGLCAFDLQYGSFFKVSQIVLEDGRPVLPLARGKYANLRVLDKETFSFLKTCSAACRQEGEAANPRVYEIRAALTRKGMWIADVSFGDKWLVTFLIFKNPEGYGIVPPDNFTFLDSRLEATVRELLSQAAATVGEEPAPAQDIK